MASDPCVRRPDARKVDVVRFPAEMGTSSAVSSGPSTTGMRHARLGFGLLCALTASFLVALLAVPTVAQARRAANLSLTVNFNANGVVTVTLPDGTPVGSTSGAPTVIPAGFYSLNLFGPGECINLPLFQLAGPGVNLQDDMLGGEVERNTLTATFLPNTTYTWHTDRNALVVHTFRTSGDVAGTPTPASPTTKPTSSKPLASEDVVGSALLPARGTIVGAVSAAGRLTLAYKGKSVTHLKPGNYTFTVTDKSSSNGFLLQKTNKRATSVTGTTFIGKHSVKVGLTAGKWLVLPKAGKASYSIVVS